MIGSVATCQEKHPLLDLQSPNQQFIIKPVSHYQRLECPL